jgi:hypothetical protein
MMGRRYCENNILISAVKIGNDPHSEKAHFHCLQLPMMLEVWWMEMAMIVESSWPFLGELLDNHK